MQRYIESHQPRSQPITDLGLRTSDPKSRSTDHGLWLTSNTLTGLHTYLYDMRGSIHAYTISAIRLLIRIATAPIMLIAMMVG